MQGFWVARSEGLEKVWIEETVSKSCLVGDTVVGVHSYIDCIISKVGFMCYTPPPRTTNVKQKMSHSHLSHLAAKLRGQKFSGRGTGIHFTVLTVLRPKQLRVKQHGSANAKFCLTDSYTGKFLHRVLLTSP